jgi:hypothetical protein
MDIMDISDLPTDLNDRLSLPPSSETCAPFSQFSHQTHQTQVTGRKTEVHKTFSSSDHQTKLLHAAHTFCESQEYIDLHIQCEDGVIKAHQMMLAVASPFLKQLFQSESALIPVGAVGYEPVSLVLPEVKSALVQALLHFVYTGNVITQEGQFYSLMKLVYALNINASIEAESTRELPTQFRTSVTQSQALENSSSSDCDTCRFSKKRKLDIDSENNLLNSISLNKINNGLVVNSFTASGVVVKEEPDEKPNFLTEFVEKQNFNLDGKNLQLGDNKSSYNMIANGTTNQANNNQLGHFVSVNPGYQIKMEVTGQGPSPPTSSAITTQPLQNMVTSPNQSSTVRQVDPNNPDDPLAAIMNQTIFGGDNMNTMFIQVNTNSFLSTQNSNLTNLNTNMSPNMGQQHNKDLGNPTPPPSNTASQDDDPHRLNDVEELPCVPDDDDLNISYNCETCNRAIKGKVMLQAHQYQEHHENPDFEASSFPEDKFACRVCLKLFTRNSDVKAHILRVHCGDRRYPCTMCGKRFKESTHLRKHLYTHTGERPHYCSLCSKGFQTSSDLKRHKKTRVHQERVDQAGSGPPTDVNLDYNEWSENGTDDKDLDPNRGVQTPTPPFGRVQGSTQSFTASNQRNHTSLPYSQIQPTVTNSRQNRVTNTVNTFTSAPSNFINQNTQPFTSQPQQQQKPMWQNIQQSSQVTGMSNLLVSGQNMPGQTMTQMTLQPNNIMTTSNQALPIQTQSLSVQNCTLPSTTLDLSDIKWGILDQSSVVPLKRSGSHDSPNQDEERLTIQEDTS